MEFLSNNIPQALMVFGVIALIIEVAILGFATFVLFFVGLSLVFSSGLMYAGLLGADWLTALWVNAVITTALAGLLWKPLKRLQNTTESTEVHSDFAELTFTLEQDVDEHNGYKFAYSGIEWQVKSRTPVKKGVEVKVVKKEVGVFWVEPLLTPV